MVKPRITAHMAPHYIGKEVTILGSITNKSSNGTNLELTADGERFNVTLSEPIDSNVEGYMEVSGILQSKSTMKCTNYVVFPPEISKDFDYEHYKEMINILNVLGEDKFIKVGGIDNEK